MFLVESLHLWNGQEVVYNKHVNKRNHKQWIVLNSKFKDNNRNTSKTETYQYIFKYKKDSSIKYKNTVWTGFEHGRLKQTNHLQADDLTDYPSPLLNTYIENKRKFDIKHKLNSFFRDNKKYASV